MEALLNWLQSNGFIQRYTADGKKCILVLEFVKHQNPHKNEAPSELPDPSGTDTEEIGTNPEKIGSTRADSLSSDSLLLIPDTPAPAPAPQPAARSEKGYSQEFEAAWAKYPTRPGNSKADAFKAWTARIKAGATVEQLADGVRRYADFCVASETEPQFVKQAATFFGPGEHYLADWTPPPRASPAATATVESDAAARTRQALDAEAAKQARQTGPTPEQLAALRAVKNAVKAAA
jgi:hypothetical protein